MASCCKYEEPTEKQLEHMKKCWHFEAKGIIVMNPVTFIASFVILWAFVIACCVEPDYMGKAMAIGAWEWIPEVWTWLYIVSQDIWILVLLWAMYKYGDLKLGKDEDEPEFSTATWFSMLFCAGVAVGLTFYGVAEPVWHYKGWGNPRFISGAKGYGNQDEDGTLALMVTFYHWGLHGWIPYTLMGSVIGIMTYRRDYPMTIRYCFVPLIGDAVYGWIGDLVDIMSVVTTIAGVCTSLGLGARQINNGLQRVNHGFYRGINYGIPDELQYSTPTCGGTGSTCAEGQEAYGIQSNVGTQILIICIITSMACLSVVLGLKNGIKFLSQFVFAAGNFLMLIVLFSGETYFVLDALVQSVGYYIWYIVKIGFQCDAFERLGGLNMGLGGNPDGTNGGDGWLTSWTLFYWGWWISWGPFVGTFIARISKGRTLRSFIASTLIVPTLYSCVWFSVLGGEGIRMQRMADAGQLCAQWDLNQHCSVPADLLADFPGARPASNCYSYSGAFSIEKKKELGMGWNPSCKLDPAHHGGYGRCQQFGWTRHVEVAGECVEHTSWVDVPCGGGADPTATAIPAACEDVITDSMLKVDGADQRFNHFPAEKQAEDCFVPLQDGVVCHWNHGAEPMPFDQLASYFPRDISSLMSVIIIIVLTLYFVTSSDSGSLVVDFITANGHPDPPMLQRIIWSWVEGATAIALLYSGVNNPSSDASLKALQAASIIAGLPYTFVLFWCSQSLYLLVQEEAGDLDKDRKAFSYFIFNLKLIPKHLINTAAPWLVIGRTIGLVGGWPFSNFGAQAVSVIWMLVFGFLYYAAIILGWFVGIADYSWHIIGLVLYLGFGLLLGLVRNGVRLRYRILHGDLITDILCGIFVPMFTISQIEEQIRTDKKDDPVPVANDDAKEPREEVA
jgi:choline-glycine betaine transporter